MLFSNLGKLKIFHPDTPNFHQVPERERNISQEIKKIKITCGDRRHLRWKKKKKHICLLSRRTGALIKKMTDQNVEGSVMYMPNPRSPHQSKN